MTFSAKLSFLSVVFATALLFASTNSTFAATGRTCCKPDQYGNATGDCNKACSTTIYYKTYEPNSDPCAGTPAGSCEECVPEYSAGNACTVADPTSPPPPTTSPTAPSCTIAISPTTASVFPFGTATFTGSPVAKNGSITSVAFRSGSATYGTVNPLSDTVSPYQTVLTATNVTTPLNTPLAVAAVGTVAGNGLTATCIARANVTVKPFACTKSQCVATDGGAITNGKKVACSMTSPDPSLIPAGGSIRYEGKCTRSEAGVVKETINLTSVTGTSAFQPFTVTGGDYKCAARYCIKNVKGLESCMPWGAM